jgi:hypothetical protein
MQARVMMNIILQGGPFHGRHENNVSAVTRLFLVDEEWVYKIGDGVFLEGSQVFNFDEKATEEHRQEFFAQFA